MIGPYHFREAQACLSRARGYHQADMIHDADFELQVAAVHAHLSQVALGVDMVWEDLRPDSRTAWQMALANRMTLGPKMAEDDAPIGEIDI